MTEKRIKSKLSELRTDRNLRILIVIILSLLLLLIAVFPLFAPTHRGTADGLAHKFRLVSFVNSLEEGNLRPRWLADPALGFGSPIFLFNYLFPYYAIALIKLTGLDIRSSVNIYEGLTVVTSFLFMFLLVKELWGKAAGLTAAVVYTYAPYHLLTIYLYEGWGEMTAFVFPPLILFSVLRLRNNPVKCFALLTFTFLLFILSHNVSVLIYTPILLLLGILLVKGKKQLVFLFGSSFVTGALISAFFALPAVLLNHLTAYPALIEKENVMRGSYFKLILTQWQIALETIQKGQAGYYDFTIGLPLFLLLITFPLLVFLKRKRFRKDLLLIVFLYLIFIFFIFLSAPASRLLWQAIYPLRYVVYPFRFLHPATFLGAILIGFLSGKKIWAGVLLIILSVISGFAYTKPKVEIFPFDDQYFSQVQTISSAPGTLKNMAAGEFLPKTADTDFIKKVEKSYFQTKAIPPKFQFSGSANIVNQQINTEKMSLTYTSEDNNVLIVNSFYFPNWSAFIDGKKTVIEPDKEGRINLRAPKGSHRADFVFGYLETEKAANIISLAGLTLFGGQLLWMYGKLKSKRN